MDIDAISQQVQATDTSTVILDAMFLLDAQRNPPLARKQLQDAAQTVGRDGAIHMVCWVRNHWLLATFRHNQMQIADSCPGIATGEDLRIIAEFAGTALKRRFTLVPMKVPKQPKGSIECGAHTVANIILAHKGWLWPREATDRVQRTISYAPLAEAFQFYADAAINLEYIRNRILSTLGEADFSLPSASQILHQIDIMANKKIHVRWMNEGVQRWTGHLVKRNPTHWIVKYDEMNTTSIIPNKECCYFTIEDQDGRNLHQTHGDLLALNFQPPSSTARVEGDNLTVKSLKEHLKKPRSQAPFDEFFTAAVAPTTRRAHMSLLNVLLKMPSQLDNRMITEAIPQFIRLLKAQRSWRNSTVLTKMAAIQGALKVLTFYIPTAPSIILSNSTRWRTVMRGATIEANAETPHQSRPVTSEDLYKLLSLTSDQSMHAFLEITWLTAGRVGDTLQLTPANIIHAPQDLTMVQFTTGKTARNGQYSVAVPPLSDRSKMYLQESRNQPYLFPSITQERVKETLRSIDIRYECRSIRRGRLQELSSGGMSDNALLHISRHSSICSLRRYLDFGLASGENVHRAHLAARATILAQRRLQTLEPSVISNLMGQQIAPPARTSNEYSHPWLHGNDLDSLSSLSSSDPATGDE